MPSRLVSPACSAMAQQFLRVGRPTARARTPGPVAHEISGRTRGVREEMRWVALLVGGWVCPVTSAPCSRTVSVTAVTTSPW